MKKKPGNQLAKVAVKLAREVIKLMFNVNAVKGFIRSSAAGFLKIQTLSGRLWLKKPCNDVRSPLHSAHLGRFGDER